MGCINSATDKNGGQKRVETLKFQRQVTRKDKSGKNAMISVSVIGNAATSDEDVSLRKPGFHGKKGLALSTSHKGELCQYFLDNDIHNEMDLHHKHSKSYNFRTISFMEGRRFSKFPEMIGYKTCLNCNEHKQDVLKTAAHNGQKEMCRSCSLKNRRTKSVKLNMDSMAAASKLDITAFANLLALTALDLNTPAAEALLKNRKNSWIQLAGHPGGFAPAGPNTIWKKRYTKDNNETIAYECLMEDPAHNIVPVFYREVEYNTEYFIEMEDLLQHFHDPNIMDMKMGTRTFLESEVSNTKLRCDLYDKMVSLDPNAVTAQDQESQGVTKLKYMQFREQESSTANYGFRIEALRMSGEATATSNLKQVKSKEQIVEVLSRFIGASANVRSSLLKRLLQIRQQVENSPFFISHEIIGSSILLMYDKQEKCGAWLIDFSKTIPVPSGFKVTHRSPWKLGNHEDGFLTGLDNLIQFLTDLEVKTENGVITHTVPLPSGPEGS